MVQVTEDERRRAFSVWLRRGILPSVRNAEGMELKFNPWHDPADGRFTFAGSGQNYGASGASSAEATGNPAARSDTRLSAQRAKAVGQPAPRQPIAKQHQSQHATRLSQAYTRLRKIGDFAAGVGEGAYEVGRDAVAGMQALVTTNPLTSARNITMGIADKIDGALEAENTPAQVQIERAIHTVRNASARDVGHAVGTVAGNVALTVAPGATLGKVTALRRLRGVAPRVAHPAPEFHWRKETLTSDKAWKTYNDSAPGFRAGHAPALKSVRPDGSTVYVKFDGLVGEYPVDRKWSVGNWPSTKAQALRQSDALAQNHTHATWEVPDERQRRNSLRLFKKLKVTNIKTRIVKP